MILRSLTGTLEYILKIRSKLASWFASDNNICWESDASYGRRCRRVDRRQEERHQRHHPMTNKKQYTSQIYLWFCVHSLNDRVRRPSNRNDIRTTALVCWWRKSSIMISSQIKCRRGFRRWGSLGGILMYHRFPRAQYENYMSGLLSTGHCIVVIRRESTEQRRQQQE